MKNLTTKLMIAAAALVAAGAASAQSLKADVPFAFQANGKSMPAGTYKVNLRGPAGTVRLQGDWKTSDVFAQPVSQIEAKNESAKLVFSCRRGTCTLIQAWSGDGTPGEAFKAPKVYRNEEATLTVIHLHAATE